MTEIRYSYKAVPTIKKFSESNQFIRGLMGPFGSGKSSGCAVEIIQRAHAQQPGPDGIRRSRWAVVRNTYPQLRDTSIKTFLQWFPPNYFGRWHETSHTYTITNFPGVELEVMFRALDRPDQVDNLLSLELTAAWVNEARELPYSIIQALQGRVGRFPKMSEGGATWFGLILDTNPPDTDSWWYRVFEEEKPPNAEIFKQPSGLSKYAENLSNLPENYYTNLSVSLDREAIKVYVEGKYGFVMDGKAVYPEYSDIIHCAEVKPIKGLPIHRGWDFGLTPSCVLTQMSPAGNFNVLDEIVSDNLGIDRFSDRVLSHCGANYHGFSFTDIGDPAGQQRAQTDETTCFQILQAKGVDIESGVQTLAMRLESVKKPLRTIVGTKPCLQLDPKCKTLRKGFQGGYQYRRIQVSVERYTEEPDKNMYSHPHDALQYVSARLFASGLTSSTTKLPPLIQQEPELFGINE